MLPSEKTAAPDLNELLRQRHIRALIFDLDGVVTQTAKLHAAAWKKMFDEFLQNATQNTGKSQAPFNIENDYPRYLDGISRTEGIRNFLASRNLKIPLGKPEDTFENQTIWGLGNQKNAYYQEIMRQGVDVYEDTVAWIKQKRAEGFRIAIISASKNCREVLRIAGLETLFEVQLDGIEAENRLLKTKPEPDIFLEAAKALNVQTTEAAVFEDARAGVQAGKAGKFGLVVGVNRKDASAGKELLELGADLVITQFPADE
ncbi:HAD family hydrolase [Adhaeribacter terreus]|uniref:Beta-phosphoglucomutase n=1 Tax=Adhaeribacter terreus TaxID=529703 RepID=A0ABW0EF29_9BACT